MKKSFFRKKLKNAAVSLAAACSLALTSFTVPVLAAGTDSGSVAEAEDKYLTAFPENKDIPLTNIEIPYEDVCKLYSGRDEKYIVLPGDTVVFTPEKVELVEQIGYYGQKEKKGSALVDFLPIHDPDDTYVPTKALSESSFINGETYQIGTIHSNGVDYETAIIPEQSEVSEKTAKVGFVNDSDCIIRFAGSGGWGPFGELLVCDMSGGAAATVLQIDYRQHSMEYRYLEVEHELSYVNNDSSVTWQGSEALLPKKYAYRNAIDAYTLYFPCPVKEGKHFWYYSQTADEEESGWTSPIDLNIYQDNAYSVKGQRMIVYNYEVPATYDLPNYGGCSLEPYFTDGYTMTVDGNGGTVDGHDKWIAELDSVDISGSDQRYAYGGTTHAINLDEDFDVVRDGYTVAGWYYMVDEDEDGTYERHPFYGFEDDRTYYEEYYDGTEKFSYMNWNIVSIDNVIKVYPVWVDSEGNYSDPNTGLTTPLEEVVIPKEEGTTEQDTTEQDTTEQDPIEEDPITDVPDYNETYFDTTYDADKYEDGFIAFTTYKCYKDGVEVPNVRLNFTPADDEKLAELDAKGIHLMDPRIAAAGYDANTVAAFVDYNGAWTESSYLSYQVGTWDSGSGSLKSQATINMPYKQYVWLDENSATEEGAALDGSFLIMFQDYFYGNDDYKAYVFDELSTSGKTEIEKTLADNETAIACFTTMLKLDKGEGSGFVNDKMVELFYTPDIDSFKRYDEYKWYELKDYKKAGTFEPEFSSAGIGAYVNSAGTYLLVGISDKKVTSIENATVSGLKTTAYTGKAITPAVTVKLDGKTLKKGTDYTVKYANNKEAGTATVTITGAGDYSGTIKKTFKIKKINFKYRAYVQKKNWMTFQEANVSGTKASNIAGTTDNLRMETIQMRLSGVNGDVKYRAYVQKKGWTQWGSAKDSESWTGTKGLSLRLEMIQLQASGEVANLYDMYYRAYSEKFGWLGWAKSGEKAGSAGYGYKLEAFQVNFVQKGGAFTLTSPRAKCFYDKTKDGTNPK